MVMLRRMTVRRGIAAPDMSAGHAKAEMDPLIAHLETLLATVGPRRHVRVDVIQVGTLLTAHD